MQGSETDYIKSAGKIIIIKNETSGADKFRGFGFVSGAGDKGNAAFCDM